MRSGIRKRISFILALSLILTMNSQTAFAAEKTAGTGGDQTSSALHSVSEDKNTENTPVVDETDDDSASIDEAGDQTDTGRAEDISGDTVTISANGGYFGNYAEDPTATVITLPINAGKVVIDAGSPESSEYPLNSGNKAFSGWYLNPECTLPASWDSTTGSYRVTDGDILYAGYVEAWTVTFDLGEGYYRNTGNDKVVYKVRKGEALKDLDDRCHYPEFSFVKNDAKRYDKAQTLACWHTEDLQDKYYDSDELEAFVPQEDVTLYAQWQIECVVTLSANGGYFEWGDPEMPAPTETLILMSDESSKGFDYRKTDCWADYGYPVHEGKKAFNGWYFNPECTIPVSKLDGEENAIRGDVTLYAGYVDAVTGTLLTGEHGEFDDGTTKKEFQFAPGVYKLDELIAKVDQGLAEHTGYVFGGWYLDEACTIGPLQDFYGEEYAFTTIDDDITLYAKWDETYTITLNTNGKGTFQGKNSCSFNVVKGRIILANDHNVDLPGTITRNSGVTQRFGGWYEDQACNFPAWDREDLIGYKPTSNITLYAGWEDAYPVTFDANGGEMIPDIADGHYVSDHDHSKFLVYIKKNHNIDGDYPIPEKAGYVFTGWYKAPACEAVDRIDNISKFKVESELTLYAGWEEGFKVTLNFNGHTVMDDEGSELDSYTVNVKPGHPVYYTMPEFLYYCDEGIGFFKDKNLTKPVYLRHFYPTEDTVLYAGTLDDLDTVRVIFDANGGIFSDGSTRSEKQVPSSIPLYGSERTDMYAGFTDYSFNMLHRAPESECSFKGWSITRNGDPVDAEDLVLQDGMTLYAVWGEKIQSPETIPVVYDANGGWFELNKYGSGKTNITTLVKAQTPGETADFMYPPKNEPGLVFAGWWDQPEGGNLYSDDVKGIIPRTVTEDVKRLYAHYEKGITVHFDANGGYFVKNNDYSNITYRNPTSYTATVAADGSYAVCGYGDERSNGINDWEFEDYISGAGFALRKADNKVFGGWYLDPECTRKAHVRNGQFTFFYDPSEDKEFSEEDSEITVYARWMDYRVANGVTLSESTKSVSAGDEFTLTAVTDPVSLQDDLVWESDNKNVLVDNTGNVKILDEFKHTAYVTARLNGREAVCALRCNGEDVPVSKITLNQTELKLEKGVSANLVASISPSNATQKTVTWSTTNDKVAVVDTDGIVTAVGEGVCNIYAKTQNGLSASCKVTVGTVYKAALPRADIVSGNMVRSGDRIHLMSSTSDAVIYYTADGSDPAAVSDNKYKGVITVDKSMVAAGQVVIKAIAVKDGYMDSDVAVFTYDFKAEAKVSEDSAVSGDAADAVRAGAVDEEGYLKDMAWVAGVPESTAYTGKAITFPIRVYDKNRLLKAGTDYTLKYQYNKNIASVSASKAPSVTVTGKGQYKNKIIVKFGIDPANIVGSDFSADDLTLAIANKALKPAPILKWKGKAVANKKNAAYTVEYVSGNGTKLASITAPGEYKARLTGRGNFTGTMDVDVKVIADAGKLISKAKVTGIAKSYKYTLSSDDINPVAHTPEPTVKIGSTTLTKGTDYEVGYFDNEEVGTATVVITGKGEYAGEKKVTFKITGNSFKKVVFDTKAKVYTGEEISANAPKAAGVSLIEGTDYDVEYINNIKAGTAKAVYTGLNSYKGAKVTKKFKITPYAINKGRTDIADGVTIESESDTPYLKGGPKSEVTVTYKGERLEAGRDFTLQYKYKKSTKDYYVVVKGKGNFKGTVNPESSGFDSTKAGKMRFTATDKALEDLEEYATASDKQFKAGKSGSYYYVKPVIKDTDGKALKLNTDYKNLQYTYADYTEMKDGTYKAPGDPVARTDKIAGPVAYITVTAEGKGHYTGTLSVTYKVFKDALSKVKFTVAPQTYTGRSIQPDLDEITATVGKGAAAKPFTDFEIVSYGVNTKKGKGTIVVRGTGLSGGTKTVKFSIAAKNF